MEPRDYATIASAVIAAGALAVNGRELGRSSRALKRSERFYALAERIDSNDAMREHLRDIARKALTEGLPSTRPTYVQRLLKTTYVIVVFAFLFTISNAIYALFNRTVYSFSIQSMLTLFAIAVSIWFNLKIRGLDKVYRSALLRGLDEKNRHNQMHKPKARG